MEEKKLSGKVINLDIGYFSLMIPEELQHFLVKGHLKPIADILENLSEHFNKGTYPVEIIKNPNQTIDTNKIEIGNQELKALNNQAE